MQNRQAIVGKYSLQSAFSTEFEKYIQWRFEAEVQATPSTYFKSFLLEENNFEALMSLKYGFSRNRN